MSKPFLGVGVSFPLRTDREGELGLAAYEESVRQSILMILGTARGERVMRPDFGCSVYDLVFEPNTTATAGRISQAVQAALLRFESRIDVIEVYVRPDRDGRCLHVSIDYEVRATNNVFNLVYPFYLEGGTG